MKVLVIDASGLHLGHLGCYGNERAATPNLDRLASQSVVFDQHYADSLAAVPASSWTGRCPLPLPDGSTEDGDPEILGGLLEAAGVRVVRVGDPTAFGNPSPLAADLIIEPARSALKKLNRAKRWLLWVRLPNLSPPWEVPEECLEPHFEAGPSEEGEELPTPWFDPPVGPMAKCDDMTWERVQTTYSAVVTYLDFLIGLLLEQLGDDVLLCVTADRGLSLLEHGIIGECRPWLHDEVVHLPLLMRLPDGAEAGRRVFALTQPVDLAPTLLAAFGLPLLETLPGHDLLPLARGKGGSVRPYACTGLRQGERLEWAMRTPDWAFLLPVLQAVDDPPRPVQLYRKPEDRWEVNNLVQQNLDLADKLEQTLRSYAVASHQPGKALLPELDG